jgi:hypothetical protein
MDRNRILELALESLEKQKTGIELELEMVRAEMNGAKSVALETKAVTARTGRRRSRTAAERQAQAKRMREYWAAKKGKAAKPAVQAPKKVKAAAEPSPVLAKNAPKTKSDAGRKLLSLRMKEVWKKRKAAAAKKSTAKPKTAKAPQPATNT